MNVLSSKFSTEIKESLRQGQLLTSSIHCVVGSVFLALMSQIALPLPFTPVPITMQTFALFLLVISQGQKKATVSTLLYLAQATLGLPVLAGGVANPLWAFCASAGYLFGFVGFTLVAGYLMELKKQPGVMWTAFSLACGQMVLLAMGTLYLSSFVGLDKAFQLGVFPFLTGIAFKLASASCASKPINYALSFWKYK